MVRLPKFRFEDFNDEPTGKGQGWHGDSEAHAKCGRKGGKKVSQNRAHMAEIGRKGGISTSQDREHMRAIGLKGLEKRRENIEQSLKRKMSQLNTLPTTDLIGD